MITKEEYEQAINLIRDYQLQIERLNSPRYLYDLDISVRSYMRLKEEFGMYFPIARFSNVKKSHLLSIKGFGITCLKELEVELSKDNIKLI